jgi:large subunit ribosomal protein L10
MAKIGRLVKECSIEEISARLAQRPNFFVTTINRLPVVETDVFRRKLFTVNSSLLMVKRRLGQRAIEPLRIAGLTDLLEGSVGFILAGDDILLTAKHLVEFRKAHEEQLLVRGAVIDGQLLSQEVVEQLAQLPPRPILLAQVVATLEAPIADLALTIERLLGETIWVTEQLAVKTPAEPSPASTPEAAAGSADSGDKSQTSAPTTDPEPPVAPQTPTGG